MHRRWFVSSPWERWELVDRAHATDHDRIIALPAREAGVALLHGLGDSIGGQDKLAELRVGLLGHLIPRSLAPGHYGSALIRLVESQRLLVIRHGHHHRLDRRASDTVGAEEVSGERTRSDEPEAHACTIASETEYQWPTNRSRTRIAVGETLSLSISPDPASWSISTGTGRLRPANGSHMRVRFIAGETRGHVTIIARCATGCESAIDLAIVEPESWTMRRVPGSSLVHKARRPSCGWLGRMFLHPTDVNFGHVETRELDSQYIGTGSFSHGSGEYHGHYPLPDRASEWYPITRYNDGWGSTDTSEDMIYSGDAGEEFTGSGPPFREGSGYFPITIQWRLRRGPGRIHNLPVKRQSDRISSDGKCTIEKGDHVESTRYDDPSGRFGPHAP